MSSFDCPRLGHDARLGPEPQHVPHVSDKEPDFKHQYYRLDVESAPLPVTFGAREKAIGNILSWLEIAGVI